MFNMSGRWVLCISLVLGAWARAQTDESMVLKPWDEGRRLEMSADSRFVHSGPVSNGISNTSVTEVESAGRYRFITKYPIGPTVGYQYILVAPDGNQFPVDDALTDVSIAAGSPLGQIGERSFWGAQIGLGYAGEDAFANRDGWYGKAALMTGGEIDKDRAWFVILDYDANRALYPDAPMPTIGYNAKLGKDLDYVIGLGIFGGTWTPGERLKVQAYWQAPFPLNASIEYELTKQWSIFTAYTLREQAFHHRLLDDDRRLFLNEQRLEAGVRWNVLESVSLALAGGYALNREFSVGFDDRELRGVASLSDQPYVRAGFSINY